jgi:hypothetical protein
MYLLRPAFVGKPKTGWLTALCCFSSRYARLSGCQEEVPNLQDLSGSRMCRCRTPSGEARYLEVFCKIMRLLRLEMLKHNVCVQDARTAQAMLPRLQRFVDRATSPRLGRFLGPIQLLRVAKERRQSRWLSFYLFCSCPLSKSFAAFHA